ncbi:hypothetical protein AYI68_g4130, partial [Smittium mucronatum]
MVDWHLSTELRD